MTRWFDRVLQIKEIVFLGYEAARKFRHSREFHPKRMNIAQLNTALQKGEVEIGQRVRLRGTFSEYVPFANFVSFFAE